MLQVSRGTSIVGDRHIFVSRVLLIWPDLASRLRVVSALSVEVPRVSIPEHASKHY